MKVYTKSAIFFLLINFCFIFSLFAKPKKTEEKTTAPVWVTDEGRNKLFPNSEYLTASAFGSTDTEAKSKAAAEISEIIKTQIDTNVSTEYSAKEFQNSVISRKNVAQNIDILSKNTVYQMEYTAPFYSPDYGMFICVAYINREKAFSAISPKLDKIKSTFQKAYENALTLDDSFEKIIAIQNAQSFLKDFYELYDFALAVNPEKARNYSDVDVLVDDSFIKTNELKSGVAFNIKVEGDNNNQVLNKVSEVFANYGFIVVKNGVYDYKVLVTVNTELTKTQDTYQTYPSISIEVLAGAMVKYSYSNQLEKVAGFDEATAIRRSYLNIIKVIDEELLK